MPLKDYASEVGSIHFGRVSLSWDGMAGMVFLATIFLEARP